ncbi:MAG: hypothetical protein F6K41_24740 [Symploca sp. SIO3E6]|nr:hypothetical protein [Caldora sp. SIO3E6]
MRYASLTHQKAVAPEGSSTRSIAKELHKSEQDASEQDASEQDARTTE